MNRMTWAGAAALAIILIGATAARFMDLPTNPGGLFYDEAAEGLSARQILRDPTYRPVFLVENAGREALYAYSVAAGFAVAGDNVVTLRSVAALWGVLGALGAWLIARRFGRGAGLAAAAWIAGSVWLIAISRDGMRNTIVPFFCAIALVALLAWHDRPTRPRALAAGAVFGLSSLYTYQALQLLPLLAVIWILWLRGADRPAFKRMVRQGGWFVASFLTVGAPMILFALGHPQDYLGRAMGVSAFNPAIDLESDLVTHTLRTLGMFAFVGDPNARHNVDSLPVLSWPLVGLAIVGLGVLWRHRNDARHALVLLSIPVFLIPPLLATEGGSPHFLRALGLAIPVAVVVGLGAQRVARWIASRLAAGKPAWSVPVVVTTFGALFLVLGASAVRTYLDRPAAARQEPYRYDLVAMAELARPADAVIIVDYETFTIRYVHDDPLPAMVIWNTPIAPGSYDRVFGVAIDDLQRGLGAELAATAVPVAWNVDGQTIVWAVTLR